MPVCETNFMPSSPQWVFGPFRLDPEHACLWYGAKAVPLPPKIFAVLRYLVTHPNRLVSKDELLDAVWPETAVSDAVVRVAIGTLRKALDDTAQTPRYIATLPRRGYRFLASVTSVAEDTSVVSSYTGLVTSVALQSPTGEPPGAPATPLPNTPAPPFLPGVALPLDMLPSPEAERRPITVLLCKLVDLTTLAGHLDPEDLREVVQAYHQICVEVIQRFDGYLAQYLGDGVLAYFGYPVAHEDDAQRAVRTGLGMVEAIGPLTTRLTLPREDRLAVRLGVHTGVVVVGAVGAGDRYAPLALGETPNIAACLQALAAPNTLVISAATYRLIEGYFTCEALGGQPFDGLAQPLRLYRVLGPSGAQSRLEVAATCGLTPLVDRVPEVGLLVERWARVKAGMGQVVVLAGEAGIGKSRLVQVLKDHVASEVHTCLECRGLPNHQHTAWYPVTDLFQRWLQWRPGETLGSALEQLEMLLAQTHLPLAATVPLMAALLALPLPAGRYPGRPLPPEQQRQYTLNMLLALVGVLAEQQPVLLIVDDLHWVDPSTMELLTLLIDQVPTRRIFMLLTCRPTVQPPWGFRTHLTPIVLTPLTPPQVEAMVGGMLRGQRLPAAVLEQIVMKSDGIPLFVEEVTKAVLESGCDSAAQEQDAATGRLPVLTIPTTLHEALLARLDRLGSAKGVAQLGATLGRQFSYALLRAVAPLEDGLLQRDLAALVAAELLYQRGQPPQAIYTFKHVLIQEAAYESVLQRVRRQTHQRLVQVLEAQFAEIAATRPELLAHHALRGALWDKAVTYFHQAGAQALTRSANREAMTSFAQALEALQHLPDSQDTRLQAIDLRLDLRNALWTLGELEQLFANLQEAAGLAEALGDPYRLGWVSVYLLAHFSQVCDPDRALTSGQRALAIATTLGDMGLMVATQHYLGGVYRSLGDYRQAVECFQKNIAYLHGALLQERLGLPGLASVFARSHLVVSLAECGAFTEGQALAAEGVRLAEAADHPYSRVMAYWGLGFRALRQGDMAQAILVLARALAVVQEASLRLLAPFVAAPLGLAYALAGRTTEALPLLEQAVAQAVAMRYMWDHALRTVWLSEAYLYAGQLAKAGIQAQRALEFSRAHQERGHEAYALWLLGEVAARRTPPEMAKAEAHYQQALTLAEELGMRPLQAHCHRGLGTLYGRVGRAPQARAALGTAIALYRAMEMTFWLPQAEAALRQVRG
jgi:class 3 adenylate cyclase/DNA-binding winged helix-turn-helix (wHTH) protein/tetratricopeptide (TPR) repeat protein